MQKPSVIFIGSPAFAVPSLRALHKRGFNIVAVITQPDKRTGRKQILTPVAVKLEALDLGLKVEQPETKKELTEIIKKYSPSVCVVVAYGMIISDECLALPAHGFINLHPSLLPLYRGPSPIQTALLNGDQKTGISIIPLTKEVDAGPVIAQKVVEIIADETSVDLSERLSVIGADILVDALDSLLSGEAKPVAQDDSLATFTKKIDREDGLINWSKSADQIFNQFRAFDPWPGIFTYFDGKRLKIAKLSLLEGDFGQKDEPGTVFQADEKIGVICGTDSIEIQQVQLEGKGVVSAQDFFKNYKPQVLGR